MPRKMRKSKRKQTLSDGWIVWACNEEIPPEGDVRRDEWLGFEYFMDDEEKRALWVEDGERAIRHWLESNPSRTRPANYWRHALPYAGERRFGAPLATPFLDGETDAEYLKRHGLLLKGELA